MVAYLTVTKRNLWIRRRAMALEYALFPMMGCLSKAESAFLRKWLAGEQLRLFDCARGKKRSNLVAIRKEFASLTDAEFATLRSNLQDSVAEAIGEYHSQKRPAYIVLKQIGAAETFMNRRQPEDALRTLKKAIKSGLSYEEYTFLDQMRGLRERLPEFLQGNKQAQNKLPEIDDLLQQLTDQRCQLLLRIDWLQTALKLKQGGLEGLRNKAVALLTQLPAFEIDKKSKENLLLARLYWLCLDFVGDIDGCIPYLNWAIDLARSTPWLWHDVDAYAAIEGAYFKRSWLYSAHLDHDAASGLIESYRADCEAAKKGTTQRLEDKIKLLDVRKLLHSGTKDEIKRGLKTVCKEIAKSKVIGRDLHSIILRALVYCLETGAFEQAKPWLAVLRSGQMVSERVPKVMVGFLVELYLLRAVGDETELGNAIRRLLYFATTNPEDQTFATIIAKGFKELAKSKPNDLRATLSFVKTLQETAQNEAIARYFEIFDLIKFLKAELKDGN